MFVGHGVLAFAIVASAARARDRSVSTALLLGVFAAAFGTLPDVDMLFAPVAVLGALGSVAGASAAFWEAADPVHRAVTHSFPVAAVTVGAVTAWQFTSQSVAGTPGAVTVDRFRLLAVTGLCGLVLVSAGLRGLRAGLVVLLFALGALALAEAARRETLPTGWVAVAAAVGLLTHPFGDLLTGTPPALLFPLDLSVLQSRVVLAADPTVNLLLAFFFELGTLWLGVFVLARLVGWRLLPAIRPRATFGVGYAFALVAIPSPSVEVAAPFVASVLAVGLLGVPIPRSTGATVRMEVWRSVLTALTAVTVAGVAYLGAYLVAG